MSASPPPGPPLLARATIDQDEPAEPGPEAGGGEAGEGQRAGADLQRHDGDGDAEQERDHHAVDERRRGTPRTAAAARRRRAACRRRRCARGRAARRARRTPSEGEQRAADELPADDLGVARRQPRRRARDAHGRRRGVAPHRRGAVGDGVRGDVGGAHRWWASWRGSTTAAFGRRRDIIGLPRGGPKSPGRSGQPDATRTSMRERGEQHRDVGDAVREHPHARRRRRVAGEADRGPEEPGAEHDGGDDVDPAEVGDGHEHQRRRRRGRRCSRSSGGPPRRSARRPAASARRRRGSRRRSGWPAPRSAAASSRTSRRTARSAPRPASPVTAAHPTSTGTAPAAPPMTMFCVLVRFSQIV